MSARYLRQHTPEQRAAVLRLMRHAGRAMAARDRGDWIAYADARTSTDDARAALRVICPDY
jgi:hypothetical protein